MSSEPECFVFVHGALSGAWSWTDVLSRSESMGVRAYAVDLRGHGQNRHLTPTSHQDYVDYLNFFILEKDLRNVVLVGHSLGGGGDSLCCHGVAGPNQSFDLLHHDLPGRG